MTMDKLIRLTITVIMAILYLPIILVNTVWVGLTLLIVRYKEGRIINPLNTELLDSISPRNEVTMGEYKIINLPTTSLIGIGLAFTLFYRKTIYTGREFNEYSPELKTYIVLHEMGHHESPHGMSSKKIPWNPDDRLSPLPTGVLAEVAADEYALANGADKYKWVIIKFLAKNLFIAPVNMIIRIYYVWRYNKA